MSDMQIPLEFTDAAARKVALLVSEEDNPNLKLRVYITGGGCSGFQYGFTFDEKVNEGDLTVEKQGVSMVVDPMSLQYLMGGVACREAVLSFRIRMQLQPVVVVRHSLFSKSILFVNFKGRFCWLGRQNRSKSVILSC